jgi:SPP1 gp7 family putative phage head morphogenesis protein
MPLVLVHKAVRRKRKPGYQDTRPPEAELRDSYAIAANNEPAFSRAFLRFTRDLVGPEALAEMRTAVRADSPEEAVRALPALEASDKMRASFERAYREIIQEAGQAEANRHGWPIRFEVEKRVEARFGGRVPINPFSLRWVEERAGWLIREIVAQQEANVRRILFRSFEQGLRGPAILKQIEEEVGLLEREQRAVERRFQTSLEAGVPREIAERQRGRYAKRLLRKRAERIARTETIEAQAQGRNDSWQLAREEGLMPDDTLREWVAAMPSDRTCPICRQLDGQRVALGEPYDSAVLGTTVQRPPAHPQCRCTEILVFPGQEEAPKPVKRKKKTTRAKQPKKIPPGPRGGIRVTDWARGSDGSWSSTSTTGEKIELVRQKRRWKLLVDGEEMKDLGTRATLDHAEGALLGL